METNLVLTTPSEDSWRACLDILPTRVELVRRKIGQDPFCGFCGVNEETSVHLFFDCHGFSNFWDREPFHFRSHQMLRNFRARLLELWDALDSDTFALACVVLWKLWDVRNQLVHEEVQHIPSDIVKWCSDFLEVFYNANLLTNSLPATVFPRQWVAPSPGHIKVNFDAAFFSADFFQVSAVARNEEGQCVGWAVRRFIGCPSPTAGEARAALHAVQFAKEKEFPKDGDSDYNWKGGRAQATNNA